MALDIGPESFLGAKTGLPGLQNGSYLDGTINSVETPDTYDPADPVGDVRYSLYTHAYFTLMGGKIYITDSAGSRPIDLGMYSEGISCISEAATPELQAGLFVGYNTTDGSQPIAIMFDMAFPSEPKVFHMFSQGDIGGTSVANSQCKAIHSRHSDTVIICCENSARVFEWNDSQYVAKTWIHSGLVSSCGIDGSGNILMLCDPIGAPLFKKIELDTGNLIDSISLGGGTSATNIYNSDVDGWDGVNKIFVCHHANDKITLIYTGTANDSLESRGTIDIDPTTRPNKRGTDIYAVSSGSTVFTKYTTDPSGLNPTDTQIDALEAIAFSSSIMLEVVSVTPITTNTSEETHYRAYLLDPSTKKIVATGITHNGGAIGIAVPISAANKTLIGIIAQYEEQWQPQWSYIVGDRVMAPDVMSNPYVYECISTGISGAGTPIWGAAVDDEFADDGVTWKTIAKLIKPVANIPELGGLPMTYEGGGEGEEGEPEGGVG